MGCGGKVGEECSPTEAEDMGSNLGVDRNFYFGLHINFLLQFM